MNVTSSVFVYSRHPFIEVHLLTLSASDAREQKSIARAIINMAIFMNLISAYNARGSYHPSGLLWTCGNIIFCSFLAEIWHHLSPLAQECFWKCFPLQRSYFLFSDRIGPHSVWHADAVNWSFLHCTWCLTMQTSLEGLKMITYHATLHQASIKISLGG